MSTVVLIIGDLMVDIVVDMPGEMIRGSDMPSQISTTFGGTAANVATWLSQAGGSARIVGVVGDDVWGKEFQRHLASFDIDVRVTTSPTQPTGAVVALCHPDGERSFFPDARANSELSQISPSDNMWENVSCLYMSGYTLLNPASRAWALKLMHSARERNVKVVLDPASSGPLTDIPLHELQEWLAAADVLLPNEQELEVLERKLPRSEWGVSQVITKRGERGALVETRARAWDLAAPVVQIVDTIGAGDAFAAGLLSGLSEDQPLEQAAERAIKVAAAAVSIRGAQPTVSSTLELT